MLVISQTHSFAPKRVDEISGTLDAVEHQIERRFLIIVLLGQLGSPFHLNKITFHNISSRQNGFPYSYQLFYDASCTFLFHAPNQKV